MNQDLLQAIDVMMGDGLPAGLEAAEDGERRGGEDVEGGGGHSAHQSWTALWQHRAKCGRPPSISPRCWSKGVRLRQTLGDIDRSPQFMGPPDPIGSLRPGLDSGNGARGLILFGSARSGVSFGSALQKLGHLFLFVVLGLSKVAGVTTRAHNGLGTSDGWGGNSVGWPVRAHHIL